MLYLMEYWEEYVGFDESSACNVVIEIRLVDCEWLKIERWSQMNEILFIWDLWKEYLLLFDLTSVYYYVTNYFILDIV